MSIFCTISLEAYASTFLISKLFKNINFNHLALIVVLLSFFVGRIPKTVESVEQIIDYISYLGIVTAGFIPTILFLITKVKKYDKKIK